MKIKTLRNVSRFLLVLIWVMWFIILWTDGVTTFVLATLAFNFLATTVDTIMMYKEECCDC